ncbi:MAG TPA: TolC family protein [Solimonas sp.]
MLAVLVGMPGLVLAADEAEAEGAPSIASDVAPITDPAVERLPNEPVPPVSGDEALPATSAGESASSAEPAGKMSADAAEQAPVQPKLDTLAQVLAKVWRDNPEVVQAERALQATGYDISAARSGYFPYLQLQTSVAEQSQDSVSTIYAVLPLWNGGLTGAQVDEAKSRQQAAAAELVRVRQSLGVSAVEAYVNVAQAQEAAQQWSAYIGALKRLLASIQRRAAEGAAPEADVQTAITRLRQAEAGMEGNRAALFVNRAQLAQLLLATPGAVDWPDEAYMLSDAEIAAVASRSEMHPNRALALAEVEIQSAVARGARAALWPELSLQHRQQLEGVVFDPSNDATLLVAQFQSGNGVRGLFGYRAEQQRLNAARARADAVHREIEATIEVGRTQLATAAMQLQVQAQAAEAASALVDSFMRQYEVGRKTWLEVLNAQREANDTLLQSIALKRNYWFANGKLALEGMYWHRLGAPSAVVATEVKEAQADE